MNAPMRVVWSEGMLMSPQHLQAQERFHELTLHERLCSVAQHAWGVCALEFDQRALAGGQVALRTFSGVFPSGAVVRFHVDDGRAPAARNIEQRLSHERERVDVFLALAIERPGVVNYSAQLDQHAARHRIEARSVEDAVTPSRTESIELARPNVMLRFGDEPREDLELLNVGELARDASGAPCWVGSYVVPALWLRAAPALRTGVARVLEACMNKRRAVRSELRQRDAVSLEFAADEVTRYLALHVVSGSIPVLEHLLAQPQASPYQVYLTLLQLVGQLSAFSADSDPQPLAAFVHEDLRTTFEPLFANLLELLKVAVHSRVIKVALEGRVDGLHLARLVEPELQQEGVRFVLGVQAALPEHEGCELVPRVAKVASWSEIQRYLSAAVSTVSLKHAARPPREVPLRAGKLYFTVDAESPVFRGALRERALAVHLPPPFAPETTHVELFAILPG